MHRLIFSLVFTVALSLAVNPANAQDSRPNLVMIMADDIGIECLSCYGSKQYQTPHLDRLASQGMRFRHAHSQPICTPSRVQLMTGQYNNRNYIRFGLLDPAAITFGNSLRDAGYKTCIAGKWQLQGGFEGPVKFGFDRYCLWQLTRRPSRYPNPGLEIDGVERDFKNGEFGPDVVTDYINDFITENKDETFFVYYPMIAPHWPFVPTPDHPDWDPTMWRDKEKEPGGYKDQKYWDAMVRHTDKMVGKVINHLDELGLGDNTLVMWTGDNGTYTGVTSQYMGRDYKGGKGSTKDNGTHVGFIARWPGTIEPASISDELVDFTDVYPTLLDAAGAKTSKGQILDGVSLVPAFTGQPRSKSSIYCWYHRDGNREEASEHTRDQRYKLYRDGRMYDTINDMLETKDLIAAGVPDSLSDVHQKLADDLAKHTAVTDESDPLINQKRKRLK
ncbi:sulfatase-like hydrolase/transferase [Stieleria varia]|uniref:Arylsulfatase n=1 Tax=Stieleria varia TaxID=2528005 RepID=A0A5C6AU87_9BACT|nr:sulfatase-like hydrolase/transferase [Stieleria varia]TWU02616.1 Arylsulfatase [Stieleria varia]